MAHLPATEFDQEVPQLVGLLAFIGGYRPDGDTSHAGDQEAFGNGLGRFLLPRFELVACRLDQLEEALDLPAPVVP